MHSDSSSPAVYQGSLVYNRHNRKMDGRYVAGSKYRSRDEWEIHPGAHEAAITSEEAASIERQTKKREKPVADADAPLPRKYLLTGLLRCGSCGGPMVGDRGIYVCTWARRARAKCGNSGIASERLDQFVLGQTKDVILSKSHFEAVIEETRRAYAEEMGDSSSRAGEIERKCAQFWVQIDRLLDLYPKGIGEGPAIEAKIQELSMEKADLEAETSGLRDLATVLDLAASQISDQAIRGLYDRFEQIQREDNVELMRQFVSEFVARVEVFERRGKSRKARRKIHIHGQIPALTRIALASPTGRYPNFRPPG